MEVLLVGKRYVGLWVVFLRSVVPTYVLRHTFMFLPPLSVVKIWSHVSIPFDSLRPVGECTNAVSHFEVYRRPEYLSSTLMFGFLLEISLCRSRLERRHISWCWSKQKFILLWVLLCCRGEKNNGCRSDSWTGRECFKNVLRSGVRH